MKLLLFNIGLLTILFSCKKQDNTHAASGIFESDEMIVAAEVNGKIIKSLNEGSSVKVGDTLSIIDAIPLQLQKNQLMASLAALSLKTNKSKPQKDLIQQQKKAFEQSIAVQREQLKVLEKEKTRVGHLVSKDALPKKQLDDIEGQVSVLKQQIEASLALLKNYDQQIKTQDESVGIANTGIMSEKEPLLARIAQIEDQIKRCTITSPMDGLILTTYLNPGEVTSAGKPILKMARKETVYLRTYLTAEQLQEVKINQSVQVSVGQGDHKKNYPGTIIWIADKAEFTPKTIQTADERQNLVYAVKIKVANDGFIKLGMYGDVSWK